MTPDALLSEFLKVALPLLGGGGLLKVAQMLRDYLRERHAQPVADTSSAIAITRELTDLAADAVASVRAEMTDQRAKHAAERAEDRQRFEERGRQLDEKSSQLEEATRQLEEMARLMRTRETEHTTLMERMKRRIQQLVDILHLHKIEVPAEED